MIRYLPEKPFPENRVFPDITEFKKQSFSPDNFYQNKFYLYALDLFNNGYFWEAHEVFEFFWHDFQRQGATAEFFKILIKICAAGVKFQGKNKRGEKIHLNNGLLLLRAWQGRYGKEIFAGINLSTLLVTIENISEKENSFWQIQLILV